MISKPIVLTFADGSRRELRKPGGFLLKLLAELSGERLDPQQAEKLDLIQRCVSIEEPGGGHLVEMLRALMGPTEERANR
jgi:hypothetical protein